MSASNPAPGTDPASEEFANTLCQFDTCTLADSLDRIGFQLHNRGFTHPGLRYFGNAGGTVAGYAATARVKASEPPLTGHTYFRHTEWWHELDRLPAPRIVVLEDIDTHPGTGACIGQIGAAIFRALKCVAAITNGSARDIPEVSDMEFALFAGHLSPARAYAHMVSHSVPVEIFGLSICPGDLLVADRYGVLSIPSQARPQIIETATKARDNKRSFVDFCKSDQFSIPGMESHLKQFQL